MVSQCWRCWLGGDTVVGMMMDWRVGLGGGACRCPAVLLVADQHAGATCRASSASVTGCHWRVAHWHSGLLPYTAVASLHLIGWVLVTVISAISARIRRQTCRKKTCSQRFVGCFCFVLEIQVVFDVKKKKCSSLWKTSCLPSWQGCFSAFLLS